MKLWHAGVLLAGAILIGALQGWPQASGHRPRSSPRPQLVLQLGHLGDVTAVALSPDAKIFASGGGEGIVKLGDAQTGELIRNLDAHNTLDADSHGVQEVAFSPDGRSLVSGAEDGTLKLWDMRPVRLRWTRVSQGYRFTKLAFSSDGKTLLTAGYDDRSQAESGIVRLWDPLTGQVQRTLAPPHMPVVVAWSPDRETLACSSDDKIELWSLKTGRFLRGFSRPKDELAEGFSVQDFSPDGGLLACSRYDMVQLRDVASGKLLRTWKTREEAVNVARFLPDGQTLLVMTGEGDKIELLDIRTGQRRSTWNIPGKIRGGSNRSVTRMAVSTKGNALILGLRNESGLGGDEVQLWDITGSPAAAVRLRHAMKGYTQNMGPVAFAPGRKLVAACNNGMVRLWDAQTGRLKRTLQWHEPVGLDVAFSPDGQTVASCRGERFAPGLVVLWDVQSGKIRRTLEVGNYGGQLYGNVDSVEFSPDGKLLSSNQAHTGGGVLWDVRTGKIKRASRGLFPHSFSPDGKTMVSLGVGEQSRVRLWDVRRWKVKRTLNCTASWVAFSPDGKTLASKTARQEEKSGRPQSEIRLWSVRTGKVVRVLPGHIDDSAPAFSPDGKSLAVLSEGTIKVWDVTTGKLRRTFPTQNSNVHGKRLAFSPDGKLIVSVTNDAELKFFDARSGRVLATALMLPPTQTTSSAWISDVGEASTDWIAYTPAGYYAGSPDAAKFIRWRSGDKLYPAARFEKEFYRPDLVQKALRGQ